MNESHQQIIQVIGIFFLSKKGKKLSTNLKLVLKPWFRLKYAFQVAHLVVGGGAYKGVPVPSSAVVCTPQNNS